MCKDREVKNRQAKLETEIEKRKYCEKILKKYAKEKKKHILKVKNIILELEKDFIELKDR